MSKSAASAAGSKAPPPTIDLPTTPLSLTRTPQSINIDVDDSDDEHRNDAKLSAACVVATGGGSPSDGTAVAGWCWYSCPAGLLAAATALATTHKGKGFGDLPDTLAVSIASLDELRDALTAPNATTAYFSLSAKSFRAYAIEGGANASASASASAQQHDEGPGSDTSPSPARARGSTKDKITSAVAFDFVSGIMKGVVGGEVDTLYGAAE